MKNVFRMEYIRRNCYMNDTKELYSTFKISYSLLLQESLQEGEFFNKKEKLSEVKARLEQHYHEMHMRLYAQVMDIGRGRKRVLDKAEFLDCLASKYNAGEVVLKEEYEKSILQFMYGAYNGAFSVCRHGIDCGACC